MSGVGYVGLAFTIISFLILGYAIYTYLFKMSESIRNKHGYGVMLFHTLLILRTVKGPGGM